MRALRILILYLVFVFLFGALLAPWLFKLAQSLANQGAFFQDLANNPFHRFVNRSLIIVALVGIVPFFKSVRMDSLSAVGLRTSDWFRPSARGLLLGLVSLGIAAGISWLSGAKAVRQDRESFEILKHIFNTALTALAVGILEEVLFRGAIFGSLKRHHAVLLALVISGSLYSLVHFFEKHDPFTASQIRWSSGLELLPRMMRGFSNLESLFPGFLNLFLAGSILAVAYQKTGNLYFSIGLHAGWIFWLKSFSFFTSKGAPPSVWFWGTQRLIDGWLATLILLATLAWVGRVRRNPENVLETAKNWTPAPDRPL